MAIDTSAFSQKQLDDMYAMNPSWKPTTTPTAPTTPKPGTTSSIPTLAKPETMDLNKIRPAGGLVTSFTPTQSYTATGKNQVYEASGDEMVSKQLDNLLAKNSSYLQRNRSNAMRTANTRGLLNSSIAAGAGEAAAIDAALPIAQQDAGYLQDLGKTKQQGIIDSYLTNQKASNDAGLYGVQAGYESVLSQQEHGQNVEKDYYTNLAAEQRQRISDEAELARQTQGEGHALTYQGNQLKSDKELTEMKESGMTERQKMSGEQAIALQKVQDEALNFRQKAEIDANIYLKELGLNADLQQSYIKQISELGLRMQADMTTILNSPEYDSEESRMSAINTMLTAYETNLDLIGAAAEKDAGIAPTSQTSTGIAQPNGETPQAPVSSGIAVTPEERKQQGIIYGEIAKTEAPTVATATGLDVWKVGDKISAQEFLQIVSRERSSDRPDQTSLVMGKDFNMYGEFTGKIDDEFINKIDPRLPNVDWSVLQEVMNRAGKMTPTEWAKVVMKKQLSSSGGQGDATTDNGGTRGTGGGDGGAVGRGGGTIGGL